MRLYLSGPMTGVDNYEEIFNEAAEVLTSKGVSVINPAGLKVGNLTYDEYLDIDLSLIDLCNGIVMLPGWKDSLGSNRELGYALGKGMKTYLYDQI